MVIMDHVRLALPAARVDLGTWLYSLTNDDYRRCCDLGAMKNLALGYYTDRGRRGMINVELLGTAIAIHMFLEQETAQRTVAAHSAHSRLYLLGCIPVAMAVTRELRVVPVSAHVSMLCGKTSIVYRPALLALLADSWPGRLIARLYVRAELRGFARDIVAKGLRA